MFVITGGAGFIGSYLAAALEADGREIAIVDWLGTGDHKWRNIAKRRLVDLVVPEEGLRFIEGAASRIEGVFHFGAISTTTETDVDAIVSRNIRYSLDLWSLCAKHAIPLVYASSAATYGDGAHGFEDRSDEAYLSALRPLNPYGWSKHLFDRMACAMVRRGDPAPPLWAGLKFFNVFGPNEYHKGGQRSVAVQLFEQIRSEKRVRLFRSERPDYADGAQMRDFVWVGDCADIARWLMGQGSELSGLYNVGSGHARSFRDKAEYTFRRLGLNPAIDFIDMPAQLVGKYQYHTEADMRKLRSVGYNRPMLTLEEGLDRYLGDFLLKEDPYC